MKKYALAIFGFAVLAFALVFVSKESKPQAQVPQPYSDGVVTLAGREISFDLAEGLDEQRRGLGGQLGIEENQGMLFMFPIPDFPVFWMKDMNFSIDIVWIKGDEVVDISANVQHEPGVPDDLLKTYVPKVPADRVLELKAGWAERNGLKPGDKVEITRILR